MSLNIATTRYETQDSNYLDSRLKLTQLDPDYIDCPLGSTYVLILVLRLARICAYEYDCRAN